ncbi:dihydroorotate dehydrogenase [uncultured Jatrophihabitans sp.]|uniref:dihydroorotate dehydrogenase n=1 Tax=uncultured Jatrophihabitans sp. TaxID=1610747 RepID=UPI0035CBDB3D
MSVDLTARLGRLRLPNPVLAAAGTAGAGRELAQFVDLAALGALVTPSVMAAPWAGRPAPRSAGTPSGLLSAHGLIGPGIDAFVAADLALLAERGLRVIVSIAGTHSDEFAEVARKLAGHPAVAAIEANISCPNHGSRGQMFAADAIASARVIGAVRRAADPAQPVFAKLTADVTDLGHLARVCADSGADGFSLINTVSGMVIDTDTLAPVLADGIGGLSGPAVRPIAVRCVWQVRRAVPHLPIIGSGGIASGLDALQFVLAGADAVAVGTATFGDPRAPLRVLAELTEALAARGFARLSDAVGYAHSQAAHLDDRQRAARRRPAEELA